MLTAKPHSTANLDIRDSTLGDALDEAACRWSNAVGWVFDDHHVTFEEMRARSIEVAHALLACGVKRGDFIALLAPNIAEYAYFLFGAAYVGAIITPINTRSRHLEIRHTLVHSDACILVTTDSFLKQDYRQIIRDVLGAGSIAEDGTVQSAVVPRLRRIVGFPGYSGSGALSFSEFRKLGEAGRGRPAPPDGQSFRDPVVLQYTSGTTALPKGALLNHRMVLNYGVGFATGMGVGEGEAILNTQPFYHVGGSCAALPLPLCLGCRIVIPSYYDPVRVLALIERERCVARTGFSAMYLMEMSNPAAKRYDRSSLRAAWYNGPIGLIPTVQEATGIPEFIQIYGATEGGGTGGRLTDTKEQRALSCGRALHGTEVAIANVETRAKLAPGLIGEIICRGWMVMNGYHKQPDETAKVLQPDGWLRMGDLGYLDDEGFLHFVGRIKNMIRVGGENVSAEEVETILISHPKVKIAAAIGVPDPRLQEVVMAVVELKPGETLSEREIVDFCASQMANFRVPRYVRFIDDWPLTGSGKIQHVALRERFASSLAQG